MKYKTTLHNSW